MTLTQILVGVRWLHLTAAMMLFGGALFPLYAPTGRFLDRPLRLALRIAAVVALVTAFAETGIGIRSLPRLALFGFAALVCLSLRRNSWTVRTQARVLAVVAGLALASVPLAAGGGQPQTVSYVVFEAVALVALGAWLGGLFALTVVAHAPVADTATLSLVRRACRRSFGVTLVAAGTVMGVASASTLAHPPSEPLILLVSLLGLAAIDRFVLVPKLDVSRTRYALVRISLYLQCLLGIELVRSAATFL